MRHDDSGTWPIAAMVLALIILALWLASCVPTPRPVLSLQSDVAAIEIPEDAPEQRVCVQWTPNPADPLTWEWRCLELTAVRRQLFPEAFR